MRGPRAQGKRRGKHLHSGQRGQPRLHASHGRAGLSQHRHRGNEGTYGAFDPSAQQGSHESGAPESGFRITADPNRILPQFGRASNHCQRSTDRRHRCWRFGAACSSGLERRNLRAQGDDRGARAATAVIAGSASASGSESWQCAGSAFRTAAGRRAEVNAASGIRRDGKAAANIFEGNQISGEAAKKIARTCRDWAAAKGGTASIYILDTHGEFVHQERGDGQIYPNMHTAMLKAQTALQTRRPTSIPNAQLRNDPSGTPRQLVQFGFFTNSGGIPIVVDGEMIGAIGVGGGAGGGGDENCAIEGLKAAFGNRVLLPVYPPKSNN